jgi:hypothetical protein
MYPYFFLFADYFLPPFLVFYIFHALLLYLSVGVSPVIFIISTGLKIFYISNLFSQLSLYSVYRVLIDSKLINQKIIPNGYKELAIIFGLETNTHHFIPFHY